MGLLSDPEYGSVKWVKVLKRVHGPLCFLCYIGALVWFVMLGNREFNNETYFSENALLPGLVTNEFNAEQAAKQYFDELNQELDKQLQKYASDPQRCVVNTSQYFCIKLDKYQDQDDMPVPWLVAKMSQLHLEVYTHNFTLKYPMGQGQIYRGTNVYGILRAPRTSSLEAIVVTAPFRSLVTHQKGTTAGIALMLAFAKFARPQKYWAKDIIFLVTEHEQLGMQAWLEAYHGLHSNTETFYSSLGGFWKPGTLTLSVSKLFQGLGWGRERGKCLNPGILKGRSGSIQAAINLEFETPKIKYIEVKVEGLNGQLPNLDLVNLVHKLCVKTGIHHSYKNSYSYTWNRSRNKMDDWMNGVWTMLGMVSAQFAGIPNGNHGLFHRFGIEAVTLEGRDANDPAGPAPKVNALQSANFYRLGVALESILRSLNNLLERFHQSYFFYMLSATNRFISIGQYMPSLCLLCVAMLIRALSLWVTIQQDGEDDIPKPIVEKKSKDSGSDVPAEDQEPKEKISEQEKEQSTLRKRNAKEKSEKVESTPKKENEKEAKKKNAEESSMSIVNIGANYLLVHLLGYAVMNSPTYLSDIGKRTFDNVPSEVSVYYGLLLISQLLALFVPFLPSLFRWQMSLQEASFTLVLALVELATACLAVGMHNFPLGLGIAAVYAPLALVVTVVTKDGGRFRSLCLFLKRFLCLLLQPLFLVSLGLIAYGRVLFPEEAFLQMLGRGFDAAIQAVMFSIVDSMIYGNWLFNVATTIVFPTWMIFWQILCNQVEV